MLVFLCTVPLRAQPWSSYHLCTRLSHIILLSSSLSSQNLAEEKEKCDSLSVCSQSETLSVCVCVCVCVCVWRRRLLWLHRWRHPLCTVATVCFISNDEHQVQLARAPDRADTGYTLGKPPTVMKTQRKENPKCDRSKSSRVSEEVSVSQTVLRFDRVCN